MPTFRGYSRLMQLAGVERPAGPVPQDESLEVADITALTDQQLDSLKTGDVVVKVTGTQKHAYTVSYKDSTNGGICLTYADCENVETVAYDKTDSGWVYNSTDTTHIGS